MGHEMKFYVRLVFVFIHKVIINPMNMMIFLGTQIFLKLVFNEPKKITII